VRVLNKIFISINKRVFLDKAAVGPALISFNPVFINLLNVKNPLFAVFQLKEVGS